MQGAQYEDLRRQAARGLTEIVDETGRGFDGYGIGGALEKQNLATIIGWVCSELPADKPLTIVSYAASVPVTAYVEPVAVGDSLPEMVAALRGHVDAVFGAADLRFGRFDG